MGLNLMAWRGVYKILGFFQYFSDTISVSTKTVVLSNLNPARELRMKVLEPDQVGDRSGRPERIRPVPGDITIKQESKMLNLAEKPLKIHPSMDLPACYGWSMGNPVGCFRFGLILQWLREPPVIYCTTVTSLWKIARL